MNRFLASLIVGGVMLALTGLLAFFLVQHMWFGSEHGSSPLPRSELQNPVVAMPADPKAALATVVAKIPYPLMLPTYFATSANQLLWANYGSGPITGLKPPPEAQVMFISRKQSSVDGQERHATLQIEYVQQPELGTYGDRNLVSENFADYILYRTVQYTMADGEPFEVTYIAERSPTLIVLTFTGEQPTLTNLAKMLRSFRPVQLQTP